VRYTLHMTITKTVPGKALLLAPLFVALVAMLPRLWYAHFGLLDDGQTVRMAVATSQDLSISVTMFRDMGRFFPAYVLFFSAIYYVVGQRPVLFFLANYMVLAGITAGLVLLVRARGGSVFQATAAGLFFVLSAPAVENFYTLSKGDPPQLLWITSSLVLLVLTARAARVLGKTALALAIAVALLVANLTKETTVILIPVSFAWLVVGWWAVRAGKADVNLAERKWYFLASVGTWITFFLLRAFFGGQTFNEGTYTRDYGSSGTLLWNSAIDLVVLLSRDFTYALPLAAWLMGAPSTRRSGERLLVKDTLIWMAGWIVVFLPWGRILEYYLLPFTFGLAALSGIAIGGIVEAIRGETTGRGRLWASACLGLFLLIWPLNLINHVTDAAVQLAVDGANDDMIRFAATLPSRSILLVDVPTPGEYNYEIGVHLSDIHQRRDIVVRPVDQTVTALEKRTGEHYVAVPELTESVWPGVRVGVGAGDAVYGQRLPGSDGEGVGTMVYRTRRKVRLLTFGLQGLVCEWITTREAQGRYCAYRQRLMDARVFSYGWRIYRVPGLRVDRVNLGSPSE